jgi:hypothetical protein
MKRLLVLVSLSIVACASKSPQSTEYWRRTSDQAEPLEQARYTCQSDAFKKAEDVSNQGLAAKVAAGTFAECMRQRGWSLRDAE